jgi:hypothetical protein
MNPMLITPSPTPYPIRTFYEPSPVPTGTFCGGIAAIRCPDGYTCHFDGDYPDAGGSCVRASNENEKPAPSSMYPSIVEKAKRDLASKLGVSSASITVSSFTDVEWGDGSLGCPKPGMMYTQAIVPGSKMVLSYGGKTYDYHASSTRVFLCEKSSQSME